MQVIYLFFSVLEFKFLDMILREKTLFKQPLVQNVLVLR